MSLIEKNGILFLLLSFSSSPFFKDENIADIADGLLGAVCCCCTDPVVAKAEAPGADALPPMVIEAVVAAVAVVTVEAAVAVVTVEAEAEAEELS